MVGCRLSPTSGEDGVCRLWSIAMKGVDWVVSYSLIYVLMQLGSFYRSISVKALINVFAGYQEGRFKRTRRTSHVFVLMCEGRPAA